MTSILKGAIYCRVSTDEQEAHGTSLQSQKLSCLKFASENKLTVPEEYMFLEQYSGGFLDRPQLTHLLLLASKGLIDFVIFMKRDRVARDTYVFHKIMNDLKENNVKVFFSDEISTGDSAMDNFMGNTIIGFASREREQFKKRAHYGKVQHAKNNQWTGSHVPFGYIKNPKTKELEINEEEKEIALRVIKNYLEDNMTLQAIGMQMEKEKILPPPLYRKDIGEILTDEKTRKNDIYFWHVTTVKRLLDNANLYAGTYLAFTKKYKKVGNASEFVGERPKEEWVEIKVPAIITKKQAEAIFEKLDNNRKYSKRRSVRNYMLQSKLFCDCEYPELHNFVGYFNNQKELRNYRCSMHNRSRVSENRLCKNHVSGLKIERIVIDTLKEIFLDPEYIIEKAIDRSFPKKDEEQKNRYTELYGLILEIDKKHKRNEDLYVDGAITRKRFDEIKITLDKDKENYSNEMAKEYEKLKSELLKENAVKNINTIIKELREEIESFFDNASYDDLKELVGIVVDKVIVSTDKNKPVKITLKIPGNIISFSERYYEEDIINFLDENGKVFDIHKTGEFVPKLLKLDPTKHPFKYRTVEFKKDDGGDDNGLFNDENKFLTFIKNKYNQFYKCDHERNTVLKNNLLRIYFLQAKQNLIKAKKVRGKSDFFYFK
ncbi:MAG: recombinase family protein [Candidatus Altimarinota bacterium]